MNKNTEGRGEYLAMKSAAVIVLCVASSAASAAVVFDLNSLTEGAVIPRPSASFYGYWNSVQGVVANVTTSMCPNTEQFNGPTQGRWVTQVETVQIIGQSDNWHVISGGTPIPSAFVSGAPPVRLVDVSTNADTGWRFTLSDPGAPSGVPKNPRDVPRYSNYGTTYTLTTKGADLTPGHTYSLSPAEVGLYRVWYDRAGAICWHGPVTPLDVNKSAIMQSDTSAARVSVFVGSAVDAGTIENDTVLGRLMVDAQGAVGGQSAAVRWDPGSWVQGAGPTLGDQFNILSSRVGAGKMTVALTCPVGTQTSMSAGAPSFFYGDTTSLACDVTKAGTEDVVAGEYVMSIQAAVRTP